MLGEETGRAGRSFGTKKSQFLWKTMVTALNGHPKALLPRTRWMWETVIHSMYALAAVRDGKTASAATSGK